MHYHKGERAQSAVSDALHLAPSFFEHTNLYSPPMIERLHDKIRGLLARVQQQSAFLATPAFRSYFASYNMESGVSVTICHSGSRQLALLRHHRISSHRETVSCRVVWPSIPICNLYAQNPTPALELSKNSSDYFRSLYSADKTGARAESLSG